MFKEKRIQISFSILLILIVASTLYYKDKLNGNNIMSDKSYAYMENSEVFNNILEEAINKISLQDQTFNENDYKITYDRIDNHNGKIIFTYVIEGVVETNKSYTAIINKSKVEDIIFNSIKTTIIKRVKNFNENKKEEILLKDYKKYFKNNKILNSDKTINRNRLINSISDCEEKYNYDSNSKELSYTLNLYNKELEKIKILID